MGLPFKKLLIASNENDILTRFIHDSDYSIKEVTQTCAPSIDIQVASNFERLLFDAVGRNSARLTQIMSDFAENGVLPKLSDNEMATIKANFAASSSTEEEVRVAIHESFEKYGELIDPHTAVGLAAIYTRTGLRPALCLATASAAKFPDVVKEATGIYPNLPQHLQHILEADEVFDSVPNDINAIKDYINTHVQRD